MKLEIAKLHLESKVTNQWVAILKSHSIPPAHRELAA